jgi:hypothetical protein
MFRCNRFLFVLSLTAAIALPNAAVAQQRATLSGPALLTALSTSAATMGRAASGRGQMEAELLWLSWSRMYRNAAAVMPPGVTAVQVAQGGIAGSRQAASAYPQYARFYRASEVFWMDVANQLVSGRTQLAIHFPREMLMQVPGAPGTPWVADPNDPQTRSTAPKKAGAFGPGVGGGICPLCHGAGREVCLTCKGTGMEDYSAFANFYGLSDDAAESLSRRTRYKCTACGGSGFKTCAFCHGTGRTAGK